MKTWFEKIDGDFYLVVEFSSKEAKLLAEHHELIDKLTNFDFSRVFGVKMDAQSGSVI
jgi:hypothetical protein